MKIDLDNFSRLVPIDSLKSNYQNELAHFAQVKELSRGEALFRQGDTDKSVFYLQSGAIELTSNRTIAQVIVAGSEEARYALSKQRPRRFTGTVQTKKAVVLQVSSRLLDKMLAWAQITEDRQRTDAVPVRGGIADDEYNWMTALPKTKALFDLPSANIQRLIGAMEPLEVKTGETIIHQGEPGDYFYIIKKGGCRVARNSGESDFVLAELREGDSFGEEALISGAPRNANVSVSISGTLMRLSKRKFKELLVESLLKRVALTEANQLIQHGAIRVDVRMENEFDRDGLKSSLNIPLYLIRIKAPRLSQKKKYILYCDTGERSSAAAFLMGSMGFDIYVLKGGLSAIR